MSFLVFQPVVCLHRQDKINACSIYYNIRLKMFNIHVKYYLRFFIHSTFDTHLNSPTISKGSLVDFTFDHVSLEITFSKQHRHQSQHLITLGELSIKAEIWNMTLIISNINIPPHSSCSNGYQYSIEYHLTTQDTLILGDFNAHHPSWYSRSTDTKGKK